MRMLLCGGMEGLLLYHRAWQKLACPLKTPTLVCAAGGRLAVADRAARRVWAFSRETVCDPGLEKLWWRRGRLLTLSGDCSCVSLLDVLNGQLLLTAPAGVFPQDGCLLPGGVLAICGGGDGRVHLLDADTLRDVGVWRVPGQPQRAAWSGGKLYLLSLADDAGASGLLCRLDARGRCEALSPTPAPLGALCPDGEGGAWVACHESLWHVAASCLAPDRQIKGTELIRHLDCQAGLLAASDPMAGRFDLFDASGRPCLTRRGALGQALFLS